jgi:hypothetical protein
MNVWLKKLWDRIYKGNSQVNFNGEMCKNCCTDLLRSHAVSFPQPFPYIGSFFFFSKYRLLFVGSESFGNNPRGKENPKLEVDYGPFLRIDDDDSLDEEFWGHIIKENSESNFWKWVINISINLEGEKPNNQEIKDNEALYHMAYSNLLKCQVRPRKDEKEDKITLNNSTYQRNKKVINNCITTAQWIYREIEEIDARNVIIFAGSENNGLARAFLKFEPERALTKFKNTAFYLENLQDGDRRIIVTNHPSARGRYRPPDDLRDEIVKIIKSDVRGKAWSMPKPSIN